IPALLSGILLLCGIFIFIFMKINYEFFGNFKSLKLLFLWFSITFVLFLFKNKYLPFIFCFFSLIFNILLSVFMYPFTYSISLKELSLKYKEISKKQDVGYAFWDIKPSFLYYSKKKFKELHKNEEVEEELKKGNSIIIKEKNFNCLPRELKKKIRIQYKEVRPGEDFYIISIPGQKRNGL
ncbi:MAG: hypothetical protein WHV67_05610, partial [Thermoanaerobaculia bacterium]